ncbi:MAG: hypothetical protein AAF824_02950 [Bacteroidota bacterium]
MAASFYFLYQFFDGIGWTVGITLAGFGVQTPVIMNHPPHTT